MKTIITLNILVFLVGILFVTTIGSEHGNAVALSFCLCWCYELISRLQNEVMARKKLSTTKKQNERPKPWPILIGTYRNRSLRLATFTCCGSRMNASSRSVIGDILRIRFCPFCGDKVKADRSKRKHYSPHRTDRLNKFIVSFFCWDNNTWITEDYELFGYIPRDDISEVLEMYKTTRRNKDGKYAVRVVGFNGVGNQVFKVFTNVNKEKI